MNEGFTVFLERKILRALNGEKDQHLHVQTATCLVNADILIRHFEGNFGLQVPGGFR